MPPPLTEKQWIAAKILEQSKARVELEMSAVPSGPSRE